MNCLEKDILIKTDDNNKIWCNNNGVSGEKYYNIILTILIITFPYILLISIIIKNKNNISIILPLIISSIFYISQIISIIITAFSDPGILHKQERDYKYRPKKYYFKYVINGHLYELNYCKSCLLFRPPRASHCQLCDNCIIRFDHHCKWIGQCIGQKNYGAFYSLVFCLFFSCLFYIIYSAYYIIHQAKKYKKKENYNKLILWGFSVIAIYNILIVIGFVGKLFFLHTYLQFYNKTFYEYLKNKFGYIPGMNPFKKYILYICKRLVLKCPGKSFYLYFIKHPDKLKLMTLDEEIYLKEDISFINKNKKKLPKINFDEIKSSKDFLDYKNEENNNINNEINNKDFYKMNITNEEGDFNFNKDKAIIINGNFKSNEF